MDVRYVIGETTKAGAALRRARCPACLLAQLRDATAADRGGCRGIFRTRPGRRRVSGGASGRARAAACFGLLAYRPATLLAQLAHEYIKAMSMSIHSRE